MRIPLVLMAIDFGALEGLYALMIWIIFGNLWRFLQKRATEKSAREMFTTEGPKRPTPPQKSSGGRNRQEPTTRRRTVETYTDGLRVHRHNNYVHRFPAIWRRVSRCGEGVISRGESEVSSGHLTEDQVAKLVLTLNEEFSIDIYKQRLIAASDARTEAERSLAKSPLTTLSDLFRCVVECLSPDGRANSKILQVENNSALEPYPAIHSQSALVRIDSFADDRDIELSAVTHRRAREYATQFPDITVRFTRCLEDALDTKIYDFDRMWLNQPGAEALIIYHLNKEFGIDIEKQRTSRAISDLDPDTRKLAKLPLLNLEDFFVEVIECLRSDRKEKELVERLEEIRSRTEPYLNGVADAIAVVDRARHAFGVAAAVADVNSRLGTQASEIETVMTYCCRTDTNQETGNQYPVMFLDETVLSYLRIHPSNQDLFISLVLGTWVDPHLGPTPVLFIWTSKTNQQRMVAAIWPGVKCNTADLAVQLSAFRGLEKERELHHSRAKGAEGGLQRISDIAIYVQGKDGLDLKMGSHYVPFKLWNSLIESVVLGAVSKALVDTAKPWPYPSQIEGGIVNKTPSAADFKFWY